MTQMQTTGYVKPNNSGTKQIFKNPVLESLSRTHVAVPISMFLLISAGLVYYGLARTPLSGPTIAGLYAVGLLLFTFVEYIVHRKVFHLVPDTPTKATFQYRAHGVHHEYPKDKTRLAMPPILSLTISSVLLGLTYLALGDYTFGFLPGFLTGYALYLFVHYAVHAFRPPKNIFKALWVHHGIHHYKNHDVAFGVSSPFWDWVFGTMPKK
jgi:sterol desaturase/sphingolipid hydroxylase (fatty acid hydroxylase superfamily)